MMLSDGIHKQQAMLATTYNHLVRDGTIRAGTIVQLVDFICNIMLFRTDRMPLTCASYGTMSAQNKVNENLVPPVSQHPSLNSYQDQRFAAPATASPGNNYGCPEQPLYQHASPVYINRRPAGRNESTPRIIPITALNKFQTTWTIRARVTAKANVRYWGNAKNGKNFSFDLLDAEDGENCARCFNELVDRIYVLIEVYLIFGGKLNPANKKFNHLNHDLEITIYTPMSSNRFIPMITAFLGSSTIFGRSTK
ncbi:hypothetical protein EJB05_21606, partial [Eragrostis curvula]